MPATSEPRTHAEMLTRRQMALTRQENAAQRARVARARIIAERSRIALERMHRSESGRAALAAAVQPRVEIRFDPDEVHAILPPETIERSPRRIIARVAIEHGVTSDDILARGGSKAVIRARRAAIQAVHEEYPAYSTSRLGSIFGLDHIPRLKKREGEQLSFGGPTKMQTAGPRHLLAISQFLLNNYCYIFARFYPTEPRYFSPKGCRGYGFALRRHSIAKVRASRSSFVLSVLRTGYAQIISGRLIVRCNRSSEVSAAMRARYAGCRRPSRGMPLVEWWAARPVTVTTGEGASDG